MVMYRGFKREKIGLSFYYFLYMNLLKDTFNTFRRDKMLYLKEYLALNNEKNSHK